MTELLLLMIVLLVLLLPFFFAQVEHNLEVFLFIMGVAALIISGGGDSAYFWHAFKEPLPIAAAVLAFGLLFRKFGGAAGKGLSAARQRMPLPLLVFLLVTVLALLSSIITAIIASLLLVEMIKDLNLNRRDTVKLTVISCFAIGLGACLTPLGEPLATIVTAKLQEDFWYLSRNFSVYIIPFILLLSVCGALSVSAANPAANTVTQKEEERLRDIFVRGGKIYLFVLALTFLGTGLMPLADKYLVRLSNFELYWLNMVSAVLDNATLAAAEISPAMGQTQITAVLLGLMISGGMLIPGNIPNIISANKLKITSREWAVIGIPLGLGLMVICALLLFL